MSVDLPRLSRHVRDAVRVGDRAVMSSTDGVFAIALHTSEPRTRSGVLRTMVRTATRLGIADLPAGLPAVSAAWFEDVWGATALKRVGQDVLPPGLSDAGARRFLSEVGFPHVSGFLELDTLDLSTTGPVALPDPPVGQGPVFLLGEWQGARLLLDGASGRVLQDGSSGISGPLAGSSPRQFVVMARLYYWWFASDRPVEDTETDLRAWLARVDADAYAAPCWQRVFEDYNFTDRV